MKWFNVFIICFLFFVFGCFYNNEFSIRRKFRRGLEYVIISVNGRDCRELISIADEYNYFFLDSYYKNKSEYLVFFRNN